MWHATAARFSRWRWRMGWDGEGSLAATISGQRSPLPKVRMRRSEREMGAPSSLLSLTDCANSKAATAAWPDIGHALSAGNAETTPPSERRSGARMADHSEVAYTTADGNDYPAHEQTYEGFIALVKYGTIVVVAIVFGMYLFLT